jgi:hypothetical protein
MREVISSRSRAFVIGSTWKDVMKVMKVKRDNHEMRVKRDNDGLQWMVEELKGKKSKTRRALFFFLLLRVVVAVDAAKDHALLLSVSLSFCTAKNDVY